MCPNHAEVMMVNRNRHVSVHIKHTFFVRERVRKQNHIISKDTKPFHGAKSATKNIKKTIEVETSQGKVS